MLDPNWYGTSSSPGVVLPIVAWLKISLPSLSLLGIWLAGDSGKPGTRDKGGIEG